jgi:hypothetical protein
MDTGEHHKEVYAQFGLTFYMAQVLEHAIVNALLCCDLIPNRRKQVRSPADWASEVDKFMDGHFENTMAKLIRVLKQVTSVSGELEESLEQSLKARNFLAPSYFRARAELWFTEEDRGVMIEELQAARDLFKRTDLLIEEIVKPLRRRYGITDQVIDRAMEELKVAWQGPLETG